MVPGWSLAEGRRSSARAVGGVGLLLPSSLGPFGLSTGPFPSWRFAHAYVDVSITLTRGLDGGLRRITPTHTLFEVSWHVCVSSDKDTFLHRVI